MACIYLRVSRYEAAFLRTPNADGDAIPASMPIGFSRISLKMPVIVGGLRIIPECEQWHSGCYGQKAWENMCRCCPPQGGKPLLSELENDGWPTYREVRYLDGMHNSINIDSYEFVCIMVPSEIALPDGRRERITKSHSLSVNAAKELRRLIHEDFIFSIIQYLGTSDRYCKMENIDRASTESLERYFADHCIPVSHSGREKESMRREVRRWINEANRIIIDKAGAYGDSVVRQSDGDARSPTYSYQAINKVKERECNR